MSFLFPLFLAAAAAIAVPLLLHLSRRRVEREVPFGSLMFLAPVAPRQQRRRRLEQVLLLALRCLALVLLAGAFARPFFAGPPPSVPVAGGGRTVLLVDASASMRREDLWARALARARVHLEGATETDRVAVLTFDRTARTVLRFDEWAALAAPARASAALDRLAARGPGWGATDLGRALVAAAELVVDDEAAAAARTVVLVSDLQQGSQLGALGASDWPRGVRLVLEPLAPAHPTNAGLQAIPAGDDRGDDAAAARRVRVSSSADGAPAQLTLAWQREGGTAAATLALGPGESRVLALEPPAGATGATLVLTGDEQAFDNRLALAPTLATEARILYVGRDEETDRQGALFFLTRAFQRTRARAPLVLSRRPEDPRIAEDAPGAALAVVTTVPGEAARAALRQVLARGRTVLLALDRGATPAALAGLAGAAPGPLVEHDRKEAVLTAIDLGHPLFAPFADARHGDFTKIRFWRHRRLEEAALRGARVLARFDDGCPALLSVPAGPGQLLVLTSTWAPADSQLALSSKFVPLLYSALDTSAGLAAGEAQVFVGDAVPLRGPPEGDAGGGRSVRKPDGTRVALAADARSFGDTDQPGLYQLDDPNGARVFAVNIAPAESATAPLGEGALDRLAIELGPAAGRSPAAAGAATVRAHEVGREAAQRPWRWVLAAAALLLVAETLLAGRLDRRRVTAGGTPA